MSSSARTLAPGSLTESGYPRIVKEWKRGTPLAEAVVVFEGQPSDMSVSAFRDLTPGFERDFVIRSTTFWTSEYFLRRDGKLIKIEKPDDARPSLHREWLLLHLRSDWSVAGKTYPAGALIATDLEAYLKGTRKFDVLFEPTERKSLAAFGTTSTRHHLLLNELDNVRSRVTVLTHQDGRWLREPLPGLSEFGEVSAYAVDPEDSDDYFLRDNRLPDAEHAGSWAPSAWSGRDAQAAPRVFRRQRAGNLAARDRSRKTAPASLISRSPAKT